MSPEGFRTIANGMPRADVLRLGIPASKITMFDDGHLVESGPHAELLAKDGLYAKLFHMQAQGYLAPTDASRKDERIIESPVD